MLMPLCFAIWASVFTVALYAIIATIIDNLPAIVAAIRNRKG